MHSSEQRIFQARLAMLPESEAFVQVFCDRNGVGSADALRLTLIVEELFVNTIRYGYGEESEAPIQIGLSLESGAVALLYEDAAPRYNPLAQLADPPRGLHSSLESRPIGGLGVYIVGHLVRDARYAHQDGFNRLWLTVPFAG
jgi:serine/threonine-protein kinase RsbW